LSAELVTASQRQGRLGNGRLAAEAEKSVKLKQDKKSPESINCQAGFANIHKAASVRRK
jgi:hypothetical protein